ncbi:MAG: acyl carrier protein [Solobacterium sp.]|nr:acyl carrier protein [Solobacterium sp.]
MFDFILDTVMKYTPLESWEVNTESTLRGDLKMDSSDLYLLRNELGNMLETEISEEDMEQVATVMDLLKLAEKYAKM